MQLHELKQFITDKMLPADFIIFVAKDCPFLARQYVNAMIDLAEGNVRKIKSIYEPQQSSLLLLTENDDTHLNVLYTDTFSERAESYGQFDYTVVVCNQIDKSIAETVKDYVIKLPKLETWQILDYAKSLCPTIDEQDLTWLITSAKNEIERITNELDKICIFPKEQHQQLFYDLRADPNTDLFTVELFPVVDAFVNGDMPALFNFLRFGGADALEPVVIANRVVSKLKSILLVTQNPGITAEDCGVSPKYLGRLRYDYRNLNIEAAKNKLAFFTGIDLALKTSKLELDKYDMLSYLVVHSAYKITA